MSAASVREPAGVRPPPRPARAASARNGACRSAAVTSASGSAARSVRLAAPGPRPTSSTRSGSGETGQRQRPARVGRGSPAPRASRPACSSQKSGSIRRAARRPARRRASASRGSRPAAPGSSRRRCWPRPRPSTSAAPAPSALSISTRVTASVPPRGDPHPEVDQLHVGDIGLVRPEVLGQRAGERVDRPLVGVGDRVVALADAHHPLGAEARHHHRLATPSPSRPSPFIRRSTVTR